MRKVLLMRTSIALLDAQMLRSCFLAKLDCCRQAQGQLPVFKLEGRHGTAYVCRDGAKATLRGQRRSGNCDSASLIRLRRLAAAQARARRCTCRRFDGTYLRQVLDLDCSPDWTM